MLPRSDLHLPASSVLLLQHAKQPITDLLICRSDTAWSNCLRSPAAATRDWSIVHIRIMASDDADAMSPLGSTADAQTEGVGCVIDFATFPSARVGSGELMSPCGEPAASLRQIANVPSSPELTSPWPFGSADTE